MQLYVSIKINLDIPFPNMIKAYKIYQPIIPVALSYKNDGVVVSQKIKITLKKTKDAPSLSIKCFK